MSRVYIHLTTVKINSNARMHTFPYLCKLTGRTRNTIFLILMHACTHALNEWGEKRGMDGEKKENTHVKDARLGDPGPCKQTSRHSRNSSFQTCNQPAKQEKPYSCRSPTFLLIAPRLHLTKVLNITISNNY